MRRLPLRSPPRVRGKEWYLQGESPAPGITPACAGKRTAQRSQRCQKWDHPRVCGEKTLCRSTVVPVWGSPPRMRGKVHCPRSRLGRTRDHPRVCGEKFDCHMYVPPYVGSPPHMWGKAGRGHGAAQPHGITPACAGKSCCVGAAVCCAWDHPRVCGEKMYTATGAANAAGSPPRMRGKASDVRT